MVRHQFSIHRFFFDVFDHGYHAEALLDRLRRTLLFQLLVLCMTTGAAQSSF